ncbi:MAG: DMT family transporter [Alphaproteobacteria bacterium]|nr:DMT family transporter [Alphaproteobacteria bacterium]
MNAAVWGTLCSLSFGLADLIASRSGRAIGPKCSLLATFLVGTAGITLWMVLDPPATDWPRDQLWLLGVHGIATTVSILLLYWGFARGPIGVVAPIIAVHPVLVVGWLWLQGAEPGALQWAAMATAIAGAVVVAVVGENPVEAGRDRRFFMRSVAIAVACCLAYTVWVVIGQSAARAYGADAALWATRPISLVALLLLFVIARERPRLPIRWWPLLVVQATLDSAGVFFFYGGGRTDDPAIAAVTSSVFGAVTTFLAWAVFRERVVALQWLGIVIVFGSVAVLAGQG